MVGGGVENLAGDSTGDENSAYYATVGGGFRNKATARYATVPGGNNCTADGQFSFAAGKMAKALHDGTFVWGDNTTADIESTGDNQLIARSSGGVWIWSNAAATTGVHLAPNSGSWISASSRELKTGFNDIEISEVLRKIEAMPIQVWRYKGEDESVRHMGPTAEDFYASFGLGQTDQGIMTVDADGVALAAIKALSEENKQLRQEVDELKKMVAMLMHERELSR
ncbi:MAG: hypothetical protein GWN76_12285 [candidate division Zixibacteria bacterium]|nr:hypothetical protein [candidate division Zixibacteria bacterium]